MSASQAVPGPQDPVLRRRAFCLLRSDTERQRGLSRRGLLLQGEIQSTQVQLVVHHDTATVPAARLRTPAH